MNAYVLLSLVPGLEEKTLSQISVIPGVIEVIPVFGHWDTILLIEAHSLDELSRLIVRQVRWTGIKNPMQAAPEGTREELAGYLENKQWDELFERKLPQILLLHAGAVGAAQWDGLFNWLERTGHRFAGVDEVLDDPVFDEPVTLLSPKGFGLWDRLAFQQYEARAREEIEQLLQTQAAAWNREDLDAFCSVYAEEVAFVSSTGLTRGRQKILDRYRIRYQETDAMGTLSLEVLEVNLASGIEVSMLGDSRPSRIHGASAVARWRIAYTDKEDLSGMTLLVLRPDGDRWLIVQDASM